MTKVEIKECPICSETSHEHFMYVTDHSISKEDFKLKKCQGCDLIFTFNPPSEKAAGPYYKSEDYISHSDTNKDLISKLYKIARGFMLGIKERMIKQYAPGKKVLDYGAGTGFFMNHLKELNYEVNGVEIDPDARNFGIKNFGLNVGSPDDLFADHKSGRYDAISLWHVLEHLYDPLKYLHKFNSLLNKDGALFLALPNLESQDAKIFKDKWAAYDVPRHLWHFSPKTLAAMAKKAGFDVVKHRRLPFDPFYNCLLSARYEKQFFSIFKGLLVGFGSYVLSLFSVKQGSSIVYILKKSKT